LIEQRALGFKSIYVEIHFSVEEATTTFHAHQSSVKHRAPAFPSVDSASLKSLPCFASARRRTKIQSRDESKDMECGGMAACCMPQTISSLAEPSASKASSSNRRSCNRIRKRPLTVDRRTKNCQFTSSKHHFTAGIMHDPSIQ
jgi:hypothetical protein